MINKEQIEIIETAHHRNGISGVPFWVIKFKFTQDGKTMNMLGISFYGDDCYTAVFDLDKLAQGEIRFFRNSWRGDNFAPFIEAEVMEKRGKNNDGE
jgi:hypothetical protein